MTNKQKAKQYILGAFNSGKEPNPKHYAQKYGVSEKTAKGWIREFKADARPQVNLGLNAPKGHGKELPNSSLGDMLRKKAIYYDQVGISYEQKQSINEVMQYLVVEVLTKDIDTSDSESSQDAIDLLHEQLSVITGGPSGYLYRVSAMFETFLRMTKLYKMIMPANNKVEMKTFYRNIGTFGELDLTELVVEASLEFADEVNETFDESEENVINFKGVSIMVMAPKWGAK